MKTITDKGEVTSYWPDEAFMTHLQGEIIIPYKKIVDVFGNPDSNGDGYKVQAEWYIKTPDGLATIYDYKEGKTYMGKDGIAKSKVTYWHIGGHKKEVVKWIVDALTK